MRKEQRASIETRKKISNSVKKHWKENREVNMEGVKKAAKKLTGGSWGTHTEESKKRISASETGKIVSEETKEKQRISRLKYIKENPELAHKHSAKAGKKLKGRKLSKEIVDAIKEKWKNPEYKEKRLIEGNDEV